MTSYEIAVSIQGGHIVWCNGPFPCGKFSDRVIARDEGLEHQLAHGEMYIADRGYRDGWHRAETPTNESSDDQRMKASVRARHETVNSKFKKFKCLSQTFRHAPHKHGVVMGAVVNITQLVIEEESPLFSIQYKDN